jgi:NADH dehydrogenase
VKVLMLGATGFVGRAAASAVIEHGHRLRVVARARARANEAAGAGAEIVEGDALDHDALVRALEGVDAVVSLIAVRRNRPQRLEDVNVGFPRLLARTVRQAGPRPILFVSAIGAQPDARLRYLSSRWRGEQELRKSGLPVAILRFSFVLGEDGGVIDDFKKAVLGPVAVVPGDGRMRTQPIVRDDAARCIALALEREDLRGRDVDLGGPELLSYDELFALFLEARRLRRAIVHVPIPLIVPGALAMELGLPNPMIVRDELRTIQIDNVAGSLDVVRETFGFEPTAPSRWAPEHWRRRPN